MLVELKRSAFRKSGGALENVRTGLLSYELSFDAAYFVYGVGCYKHVESILIDPEEISRPSWHDLNHFDIVEPCIPTDWQISSLDMSPWSLVIGYPLLVTSSAHFDGILNREGDSLAEFAHVKQIYRTLR